MEELEGRILRILAEHKIPYEIVEHAPVYTNPEMAERLGVPLGQTVKNLMLETSDGRIIQVVLPGEKRFDPKRVAEKAAARKVSFARPETVLDVAGCEVGCVPPFGHRKPVQVYMDPQLLWKKHVYFNPGVHTKSVKIETRFLKELCKPILL
jgi:prolyl-tRNA editing enzyme YbaK/EbsC (Cys-tRNA(Pro) deacylase)